MKKTPYFLHQNKGEKLHVVAQEYWGATVWYCMWGRRNDWKERQILIFLRQQLSDWGGGNDKPQAKNKTQRRLLPRCEIGGGVYYFSIAKPWLHRTCVAPLSLKLYFLLSLLVKCLLHRAMEKQNMHHPRWLNSLFPTKRKKLVIQA